MKRTLTAKQREMANRRNREYRTRNPPGDKYKETQKRWRERNPDYSRNRYANMIEEEKEREKEQIRKRYRRNAQKRRDAANEKNALATAVYKEITGKETSRGEGARAVEIGHVILRQIKKELKDAT